MCAKYFDGVLYNLHAWVVMPNHVHVLVIPLDDHSLSGIAHSWKSYTAKQANKMLERNGKFWHEDYFDRFVRDDDHFEAIVNYIHLNPVKAGLCTNPEDALLRSVFPGLMDHSGRGEDAHDAGTDWSPVFEGRPLVIRY